MTRIVAVAALAPIAAFVGAPPAHASISSGTAAQLAAAIKADGTSITNATFVTVPGGTPNGVSSTPLAGFPTEGPTFAILTNGDVHKTDHPNDSDAESTALGGGHVRGDTDIDVSILKIDFTVGAGQNCLRFDFRFFSEEYDEFVTREFNDAFIAEVDNSNWTTSGSTINAPNNMAFDDKGRPISVRSTGNTSMTAAPSDVTYDGATPVLSASQSVTPGAHSLYLSIFDQTDNAYDSAVFVDNLVIGYAPNPVSQCAKGAAPKQSTLDLQPPTAAKSVGASHTVNATVKELGGGVVAGEPVLFTVTRGATVVTSGTGTTNAQGVASFTYTGASAGEDTITACHDANGDHDCDLGEPFASVKATWTAASTTPAATTPPAGHAGLPVTGSPAGLIAGIGAGAVVAGVVGYVLIRRRRVRFVAE